MSTAARFVIFPLPSTIMVTARRVPDLYLGFLIVPLALTFARYVEWPLWAYALMWSPVIVGGTMGMLRPSKSLVLGLQYRHRPEVFDEAA